jgi:hypothetical protein
MLQNPPSGANSKFAGQEIPRISWKTKIYFPVHKESATGLFVSKLDYTLTKFYILKHKAEKWS